MLGLGDEPEDKKPAKTDKKDDKKPNEKAQGEQASKSQSDEAKEILAKMEAKKDSEGCVFC